MKSKKTLFKIFIFLSCLNLNLFAGKEKWDKKTTAGLKHFLKKEPTNTVVMTCFGAIIDSNTRKGQCTNSTINAAKKRTKLLKNRTYYNDNLPFHLICDKNKDFFVVDNYFALKLDDLKFVSLNDKFRSEEDKKELQENFNKFTQFLAQELAATKSKLLKTQNMATNVVAQAQDIQNGNNQLNEKVLQLQESLQKVKNIQTQSITDLESEHRKMIENLVSTQFEELRKILGSNYAQPLKAKIGAAATESYKIPTESALMDRAKTKLETAIKQLTKEQLNLKNLSPILNDIITSVLEGSKEYLSEFSANEANAERDRFYQMLQDKSNKCEELHSKINELEDQISSQKHNQVEVHNLLNVVSQPLPKMDESSNSSGGSDEKTQNSLLNYTTHNSSNAGSCSSTNNDDTIIQDSQEAVQKLSQDLQNLELVANEVSEEEKTNKKNIEKIGKVATENLFDCEQTQRKLTEELESGANEGLKKHQREVETLLAMLTQQSTRTTTTTGTQEPEEPSMTINSL